MTSVYKMSYYRARVKIRSGMVKLMQPCVYQIYIDYAYACAPKNVTFYLLLGRKSATIFDAHLQQCNLFDSVYGCSPIDKIFVVFQKLK